MPCSDYDLPIKPRVCSEYAIPIEPSAATTVLDAGTVESRGVGSSRLTRQEVSAEIQAFLNAPLNWHNEVRSFLSIVMFLTRFPVPVWVDLHPGFVMRGMCYLPVVGTCLGIVVGLFFDVARITLQLPTAIAVAVSTATGFYFTGCFHQDGLADCADGIGGGWTRAQILRIMTDSRVGTYGCAAFILYVVVLVQLLAELGTSDWQIGACFQDTSCGSQGAAPALLVSHTLVRLTAPYLIRTRDYIDDEQGPKSNYYAFMIQAKHLVSRRRVLLAIVWSWFVAGAVYGPWTATTLIVAVIALSHAAGMYAQAILGGVMGDYLGATICVCELVVLTLILIRKSAYDFVWWTWKVVMENKQPFSQALNTLLQDEKVRVLLRFVAFGCIAMVWCKCVKRPATYDSDGNNKMESQNDLSTNEKNQNQDTPRIQATAILSSPTSTFIERYNAVQTYIDALAKPVGSLGTLECWAARLAALQQTLQPNVTQVACLIFAGDHGAAAAVETGGEACSAYPQSVTRSVLTGLERGVAGASVLAKTNNVHLRIVDVGVIGEAFHGEHVISAPTKLANGTRNFCAEPAMSAEESEHCMRTGREMLIQFCNETSANVVVLGEVGIGNTTSSSALIASLTNNNKSIETLCGGGAFASRELDEKAVSKKVAIVKKALSKHGRNLQAADALAKYGGAEIAAMVGAMLEASERNIAVLVDGFIATAAALVAVSISSNVSHILFFTSQSAERGQEVALEKIRSIARDNNIPIDPSPALSMGLRMGEATAALLAVPILRGAAAVLSDMATIQEILS